MAGLEQPDEGIGVFVTGTVGCLCHGDLLLIHQLLGIVDAQAVEIVRKAAAELLFEELG